ncbi:MAG: class I SAM-dependent methyltransferase [Verrucomicrobia bacterium]|nr:class I SAM-dependent methyltransferase [Verrucomicrobiota bacterium]MBS0636041.1 class I SAM-dependent methyltransferase [Verrucomicrobiota bacterium]
MSVQLQEISRLVAGRQKDPQREPYITKSNGLTAKHPENTKIFREKIKNLLVEYLKIKFESSQQADTTVDFSEIVHFSLKRHSYQLQLHYGMIPSKRDRIVDAQGRAILLDQDEEQGPYFAALLSLVVNGNKLEVRKEGEIRHNIKKENLFWDGWYTQLGDNSALFQCFPDWIKVAIVRVLKAVVPVSPPWHEYRSLIHPIIKTAALQILDRSNEATVVELCGGNGILAREILSDYKKPISYHLLEQNRVSLELARQNLRSHSSAHIVPTDVVHDEAYSNLAANSVDLVIGSGALTTCVLEGKDEAITVLKKCHTYLKPGGFCLLAGHGDSLVNSDDFQALGFTLHNKHLVGYIRSFYIAQKD